jgi:hypothetical protein
MTAYRQRVRACAAAVTDGVSRPRDLKAIAADGASILYNNVCGWFERAERGVLTKSGQEALIRWPQEKPAVAHLMPGNSIIGDVKGKENILASHDLDDGARSAI